MSLRCLFIVCLNDKKLLFHNLFRTVETRWMRKHPECSDLKLPHGEDFVKTLLNELGILNSSTFQYARDSCKKNFHAPLFWIPFSESSSNFWPVLIVECKGRLLCGVPYLDSIHPFQESPSLAASRCADIVVALELLLSLAHYAEFPASRLDDELKSRILHHLPFGRPISHHHSVDGLQTASTKTSWLRSKPKLDIKVIEEVRLSSSKQATLCELHGTAILSAETDVCNGIKLQVQFQRLKDFPEILYHSCVTPEPEKETYKLTIKHLPDKTVTLLHYSFKLSDAPIKTILKFWDVTETKRTLDIQLLLNSDILKLPRLNRLEIRMPMPEGNRVINITSASSNPFGTLSLLKDGTQLSWNIISQSSPSASSANLKVKEEFLLHADIEMEKPNVSLRNSFITVMFSAAGLTLSEIKFALQQPSDFKLNQGSTLRSGLHYRSWNSDAEDII